MARIIRFPLKMANGTEARSLEEFIENFDLETALGYYEDGKLVKWLRDRYQDTEADKLEALDKTAKSFTSDFCAVFGIEAAAETADSGADMDYISRRNEKKKILRTITDDESVIYNVDSVALNQDDLLDIFDEGKKEIYLCQGEFEIPLSVTDVTYHGIADPIVTVRVTDNVNFNEKNIRFVDCVYGWDVSRTSPLDNMKRAEHLFLKGDFKKAINVFMKYAKDGNPRAILILRCITDKDDIFMPYDEISEIEDQLEDQVENSADIFLSIYNGDSDICDGKNSELMKKLADKNDWLYEYIYAGFSLDEAETDEDAANSLKYFLCSANHGNVFAIESMMNELEDDDFDKAFDLCMQIAKNGNAYAQYVLGDFYSKNDDLPTAFEWFKKSASQGLPGAIDELEEVEMLTVAADQGDVDAQAKVGIYYFKQHDDYSKALKYLNKAAAKSNDKAIYYLGLCYQYGNGVTEDKDIARELYVKAAELGNADAMESIGMLYYSEDNDYPNAVKWFTKAAEKGDEWSQYLLGGIYIGYYDGVGHDMNKAIEYYTKSAENGYDNAQVELAELYYEGGKYNAYMDKNYELAFKWASEAAKQGDSRALNMAGDCYFYGHGTKQDYSKAFEMYQRSVRQSESVEGLKNLAKCYENGYGVEKDLDKAKEYYDKADEADKNSLWNRAMNGTL